MKRILILIFALLALQVGAQNTIDHLGKIRMRYNNSGSNDTLLIQFSGDSTYYFSSSNPFHKFKSGLIADSLKLNGGGGWTTSLIPSQWVTSGSDIYYNTGNVGINNASPSYKLDVGGLIGGSNIETNTTSLSTKLGYEAGTNENETVARYNVMVGNSAGRLITTGSQNTIIGNASGSNLLGGTVNCLFGYYSGLNLTSGQNNVFVGSFAGLSSTTSQHNVFLGGGAGYANISGSRNIYIGNNAGTTSNGSDNVIIGHYAGYQNNASGNIFLGYYSGYNETLSNKLYVDNQNRGGESLGRLKSLIYGQFDADTLNQFVDINGRLRHTATTAEIYRHVDSTARTQSIPNGTTPTKIVVFSDNGVSSHCTADAANDKITITKPGIYDVKLFISYSSGTNNVNWFARLFLGGSAVPNIHSQGNTSNANQFRSTALGGKIRVTTVPVDLDYRVFHDYTSAVNLTFISANLNVNYIGE